MRRRKALKPFQNLPCRAKKEPRMNRRMSQKVVYVGSKPIMNYVTAILTSFKDNPEQVIVKARGRAISTAVDAAEVTRHRFMTDLTPTVTIGTEQLPAEGRGTRNVSFIEIVLSKSPEAEEPRGRELTTEAEEAA